MEKLTTQEKVIAQLLQDDIPLVSSPFEKLGSASGLTAADIVSTAKHLLQQKLMRKFCAILRHRQIGYSKNALIVWAVPADQIERAGKTAASFSFVSHCYQRQPAFQNKFNLFTMLHTRENELTDLVKKLAESIGSQDYLILESIKEYKKTSPEYF